MLKYLYSCIVGPCGEKGNGRQPNKISQTDLCTHTPSNRSTSLILIVGGNSGSNLYWVEIEKQHYTPLFVEGESTPLLNHMGVDQQSKCGHK